MTTPEPNLSMFDGPQHLPVGHLFRLRPGYLLRQDPIERNGWYLEPEERVNPEFVKRYSQFVLASGSFVWCVGISDSGMPLVQTVQNSVPVHLLSYVPGGVLCALEQLEIDE